MPPTNLVIATTTLYKQGIDDPRFGFACHTVDAAHRAGYPIVVVDGSLDLRVGELLAGRGALVYREAGKTMGAGKRQSLYHAMEVGLQNRTDIISAIEIEKTDMIRLMEEFVAPIASGKGDVAVFTRSEASLATYPQFQIESELEANRAFKEAIGLDLDIMSGPVALRASAVLDCFVNPCRYFIPGVEDTYIQHYGAIVAHERGFRVVASPPLDFLYPAAQREQEEATLNEEIREKRRWQRTSLTHAYQALGAFYALSTASPR